ncbi:MAG: SBBP repeat-containing protein, partial [Candidatus Hodarchaeales archaeon]
GNFDTFVTKLSGTDSKVLWSTYLGGQGYDIGNDIAIDKFNSLYIVGTTQSKDFPLVSAIDSTHEGLYEAYITKYSSDCSNIVFSTFLGGEGIDEAMALTLDSNRNLYITGTTDSENFPITKSKIQSTLAGGHTLNIWTRYGTSRPGEFEQWRVGDSFVVKLNTESDSLEWSTYLGGFEGDVGWDIALDNESNVFTCGMTFAGDFPLANNLYYYSGVNRDGFISLISKDGTHLLYSDYYGGSGWEILNSLTTDSSTSSIFFAGWTGSSDFPQLGGDYPKGGDDGVLGLLRYPKLTTPGGTPSFNVFFVIFGIVFVIAVTRHRGKFKF